MKRELLIAACITALTASSAFAEETKKYMAELDSGPDPLGLTEEGSKPKKKKPVRKFIKGLGKELGKSGEYLAKDLFMFLSVQDIDPYEKSGPPLDKKATILHIRYTDGSTCEIVRYPDRSFRANGSVFDGTVVIPDGPTGFIVKYPNGVQGRLERDSSGQVKIFRPDKTVTTLKKTMSGAFEISNDKLGYLGTARTSETGLEYED